MKEKYFEAMYRGLKANFPRFCSWGVIFTNELDYNKRTHINAGHVDGTTLGFGRFFLRTCKQCTSTLNLTLDEKKFNENDSILFSTYIGERAKREDKKPSQVLDEIRHEYNEWLDNEQYAALKVVLGLGIPENTSAMLKKVVLTKARFVNSSDYKVLDAQKSPLERDTYLINKNHKRLDIVLIEADDHALANQILAIRVLRAHDATDKRHTPVLAIGTNEALKRGYYHFDINGMITLPADSHTIRKGIETYLNAN